MRTYFDPGLLGDGDHVGPCRCRLENATTDRAYARPRHLSCSESSSARPISFPFCRAGDYSDPRDFGPSLGKGCRAPLAATVDHDGDPTFLDVGGPLPRTTRPGFSQLLPPVTSHSAWSCPPVAPPLSRRSDRVPFGEKASGPNPFRVVLAEA